MVMRQMQILFIFLLSFTIGMVCADSGYCDTAAIVTTIQGSAPASSSFADSESAFQDIKQMFSNAITDFMESITERPGSLFSAVSPLTDTSVGGDSSLTFDGGVFGSHTVDFALWPAMVFALMKGLVMIPSMLCAIRIVTNTV